MSLKLKIFLICFLIAGGVGGVTAALFARSWKSLAGGYALLTVSHGLDAFEREKAPTDFDGWLLEIDLVDDSTAWRHLPRTVSSTQAEPMANQIRNGVKETHLKEGNFELPVQINDISEKYFVAFRTITGVDGRAKLRVAGLLADIHLWDLNAWAAPFLGTIFIALIVAAIFSFLISANLNRAYLSIEDVLERVGRGQLRDLPFPKSSDPSVERLSAALRNTVELLGTKDAKIAMVSELANEDPMTGMPNYRAFEDFMEGLMAGRFVPDTVPVLGILDLDHFKQINDTHGHKVGDFVLIETARIIQENLRTEARVKDQSPDFVGRYGGEEFVVIFTSVRADSIHVSPQRILHKLKNARLRVPKEISKTGEAFDVSVSASIGLALWQNGKFSKDSWIKEADRALYEAKSRGRGRVVQLLPTPREWI